MERELGLLIILEKPPAGVDYALQEGGGNNYKTVQTQTLDWSRLEVPILGACA